MGVALKSCALAGMVVTAGWTATPLATVRGCPSAAYAHGSAKGLGNFTTIVARASGTKGGKPTSLELVFCTGPYSLKRHDVIMRRRKCRSRLPPTLLQGLPNDPDQLYCHQGRIGCLLVQSAVCWAHTSRMIGPGFYVMGFGFKSRFSDLGYTWVLV